MAKGKNDLAKSLMKEMMAILLVAGMLVPVISACSDKSPAPPVASVKRILFLGNSYTGDNGGVDKHLTGLAPEIIAGRITSGGATLETHWRNSDTLYLIRTGKWNAVILQEQSQAPVVHPSNFTQYAGKLSEEIKKAGAQPILFMTWERPDSVQYQVTTANLSGVFSDVGQQLGMTVAPVGVAFFKALQERPGLRLYGFDGHPTLQGTYLAACVFYGIIFEKSPVGNPYSAGLPEADKTFLQKIAAQVLGY